MDLSHDGTIVTWVHAGHALFNCSLFKAFSPDALGPKLTCCPPTLEWQIGKLPPEILALAMATLPFSHPISVMVGNSRIRTRFGAASYCLNLHFIVFSVAVSGFLLL